MSSQHYPSNHSKPSTAAPNMLRMLHPTSGHQGFNQISNQTAYPSQVIMDPRIAMIINTQTQQAIAATGIPTGIPRTGMSHYQSSPYPYGVQQPHTFFVKR